MRHLSKPSREAPSLVLHGPHGPHELRAIFFHILTENGQRRQTPVKEPRPTRVRGLELGWKLAELLVQEGYVARAVQMRDAVRVNVGVRIGRVGEEGETLFDSGILEDGRFGWEAVFDGRRGGEETGYGWYCDTACAAFWI